jgi:hypothetical protein
MTPPTRADALAAHVIVLRAMVSELERRLPWRDEEGRQEVLPPFKGHDPVTGKLLDVPGDTRYGERNRAIAAIYREQIAALNAAIAHLSGPAHVPATAPTREQIARAIYLAQPTNEYAATQWRNAWACKGSDESCWSPNMQLAFRCADAVRASFPAADQAMESIGLRKASTLAWFRDASADERCQCIAEDPSILDTLLSELAALVSPAEATDTQRLDWLAEYWQESPVAKEQFGKWNYTASNGKTLLPADSLRDAIDKAKQADDEWRARMKVAHASRT